MIDAFRHAGYEVTGGLDNYSTRCPNHDDGTPSLSFNDGDSGVRFNCHAGCDRAEMFDSIVSLTGMARNEFFYDRWASPPEGPVATIAELAAAKNLPTELFAWAGVQDSPRGILFPYSHGSAIYRTRVRGALAGSNRFCWERGDAPITAYGAWMLPGYRRGGILFLVEGETDTLTGIHHGLPVLGIPSKGMARSVFANNPSLAQGFDVMFVIEEPDDYEKRVFLSGVRRGLSDIHWCGTIYPMRLPVKDLSELHLTRDAAGFMAAFQAADEAAVDASTWPEPGSVPISAVDVVSTLRDGTFPQVFRVQQIRNRHRGMSSAAIRESLRELEQANIVRFLPTARTGGRRLELFKTSPLVRP